MVTSFVLNKKRASERERYCWIVVFFFFCLLLLLLLLFCVFADGVSDDMSRFLAEPLTIKSCEHFAAPGMAIGKASMQGWRDAMEVGRLWRAMLSSLLVCGTEFWMGFVVTVF